MHELDDAAARGRRRDHESRVDALLAGHLARRSRGESHPVEDFLFTYYSYRPSALRRWHPGVGTAVRGPAAKEFGAVRGYRVEADLAYADPTLGHPRPDRVRQAADLLRATADRPAQFGCFGLHEWAMVYRQPADAVRHAAFPLRLRTTGTDAVVETHRLTCTHFDAFRFFTADAAPLNTLQPTRARQVELDQPGCLHAAMDLYKLAYTLSPLTPSELVVDCFELARDIRVIDMRASPYDLADLGYTPIRIETVEGKHEYVEAQREFAGRSVPLRRRLIAECESLLAA